MWCRCAVVYLWHTPFYWIGRKAREILKICLALLPREYFENLESEIYIPPHKNQSTFNYLGFVKTMKIVWCLRVVKCYLDSRGLLLLLGFCRGIVSNCPSLTEIDMATIDYNSYWNFVTYCRYLGSWNIFCTETNLITN